MRLLSQSILTNTIIASGGRVVNVLLGIAVTALLTRYLGVSLYGMYALILSYGAMIAVVADFGLYLSLTRDIARRRDQQQHLVSSISALRLVLMITAIVLGMVVALSVAQYRPLVPAFTVLAAGLIFQSLSQLLMGVFQTYGVVWRATVGDLIGRAIQLFGIALFPVLGSYYHIPVTNHPLVYMSFMFTIGVGASYLVHSIVVPVIKPWKMAFDLSKWKKVIHQSWPLAAMLVLNVIYFRADMIMLSFLRSAAEVGVYGLAYKIIEALLFFPAMFGGLLLPNISRAFAEHRYTKVSTYVSQSVLLMIIGGALTLFLLVVFAHPIIVFLSGVAFADSANILQVLSLALVVMFFGNVFGFTLVACNKQKQLMILYLVLVTGNVAANALFIPAYGALAAAWTTVGTEIIAMLTGATLVYAIAPFRVSLSVIGKTAFMVFGIWLVSLVIPGDWHVIAKLAAVVSVYIALGLLVRIVPRSSTHLLQARVGAYEYV